MSMSEPRNDDQDQAIVWEPSERYLQRSRLLRFMSEQGNESLAEHLAWAAEDIDRYWGAVVEDLDLEWHRPYERVADLSNGAPWIEWFGGGGFNYVSNAIDRQANGARRNQLAIVFEADDGS